mgnify:FL=1
MSFGRLERSAGSQPMSDINMTPLIDVMLVLVVIFIITAPLLVSSVRVDLPRTAAAQPDRAATSVVVVIDAAGQIYVKDQLVTLPELNRRLALLRQAEPGAELQLRADQRVPYGRIVEVMDAAQQAGLSRIGFVADNLGALIEAPRHKP